MKILHCCLAAFYIDNYSYQENILPKMHKLQGHNVSILASTETFVASGVLGYLQPSSYLTNTGIPITRIPYIWWLPQFIAKKLRIYSGISKVINAFKPDILFLHDCQFISIYEIALYAKRNPHVKIYVDGHTDFINSARTWLSRNILHRIIYKWCARSIEPYTRKFYGVLPLRVDFFKDVYKIPSNKVDLLLLGADDTVIDLSKRDEVRRVTRDSLQLSESDFVIVTGGKIDERKNIHLLMQAVIELSNKHIKLVIFGTPNKQMEESINMLRTSPNIEYVGWIESEKAYNYFLCADIGFFPGTHSVLWEQAVGVGLPCVFKKWDGIQHVDLNGNCLFLSDDSTYEIKEKILMIYNNPDMLLKMKHISMTKGITEFSYYKIAQKAIEQ